MLAMSKDMNRQVQYSLQLCPMHTKTSEARFIFTFLSSPTRSFGMFGAVAGRELKKIPLKWKMARLKQGVRIKPNTRR
jgi:hypothetical protein